MTTQVKTVQEIRAMREGGAMLGAVFAKLKPSIKPGVSTAELSRIAVKELAKLGGKPAILGYQGYPEALCVSLNDEVVHGIPSDERIIKDGDIVSCDFCVEHKGLITDAAITCIAGKPRRPRDAELLAVTEKSLLAGLTVLRDGVTLGTLGAAIQKVLQKAGLGIVHDFVGHGVGHQMHEEPGIPNFGVAGQGFVLKSGMTIAVEPMATLGSPAVGIDKDGWTARTLDGSKAAHFEHTVLITDTGYEILTKS